MTSKQTRKLKKAISGQQRLRLNENFIDVLMALPGMIGSKEEILERMDPALIGGYLNYSELDVLENVAAKVVKASNSGAEGVCIIPVTAHALELRDYWDAMSEHDIKECIPGGIPGSATAGWMIIDPDQKNQRAAWERWANRKNKVARGFANSYQQAAKKAVGLRITTPARAKKQAEEEFEKLPKVRTTRNKYILIDDSK